MKIREFKFRVGKRNEIKSLDNINESGAIKLSSKDLGRLLGGNTDDDDETSDYIPEKKKKK